MSNEFTISIHGAPHRASAYTKTAGLTIEMSDHYGSSITIFCGDNGLAQDLAEAINGVLDLHRPSNDALLDAAE